MHTCINCKKDIPENNGFIRGVVGIAFAGYGSEHDGKRIKCFDQYSR